MYWDTYQEVLLLILASLCLYDMVTCKKDNIWSDKNGFQTFAANPKRGLIALAEFGLNPSINIYQYP